MKIDITKCEYYTISGGCMSNEKECYFECCSKNNNCKFKSTYYYKQMIKKIERVSKAIANGTSFPDDIEGDLCIISKTKYIEM